MRVSAADFSYKTQKDKPQSSGKEKKKIIKKTQKLNKWAIDRPPPLGKGIADFGIANSRIGMTTTPKLYRIPARGGIRW